MRMPALPEHCVEWAAQAVDAEVRPAYSGKVMYGRTCLAIVGDRDVGARFLLRLRAELSDPDADFEGDPDQVVERMAENQCVDQMGLGWVVYWPGYEVQP